MSLVEKGQYVTGLGQTALLPLSFVPKFAKWLGPAGHVLTAADVGLSSWQELETKEQQVKAIAEALGMTQEELFTRSAFVKNYSEKGVFLNNAGGALASTGGGLAAGAAATTIIAKATATAAAGTAATTATAAATGGFLGSIVPGPGTIIGIGCAVAGSIAAGYVYNAVCSGDDPNANAMASVTGLADKLQANQPLATQDVFAALVATSKLTEAQKNRLSAEIVKLKTGADWQRFVEDNDSVIASKASKLLGPDYDPLRSAAEQLTERMRDGNFNPLILLLNDGAYMPGIDQGMSVTGPVTAQNTPRQQRQDDRRLDPNSVA